MPSLVTFVFLSDDSSDELFPAWHTDTPAMWNQTHLPAAAEEWSVSNIPVPSWDPIYLLSISSGFGDWLGCVRQTTASQSHHNKDAQPPTHLRASIQFPYTSWIDRISSKLTAGSEWNLRREEEVVFFCFFFCFGNAAVCVSWCGAVCLSLCLCECVSVCLIAAV